MTSKTNPYRYVIFAIIAIAYFLVSLHRNSTAVMIPELTLDFAINPTQAGLFGSMFFYAYAFAQLPSGFLADRWGARKTTSVFLLIAGIGSILLGIFDNFYMAMGARFLVGLGAAFIYISAMLLLAEWFNTNEYSTYVGFFVAIGNCGSLAASAPLVAMMITIGWRNSMISIGLLSVFIAALLYILVRNKPIETLNANPSRNSESYTKPVSEMKFTQVLRSLLKKPAFCSLLFLMFGWAGTLFALQGLWLGPYLINVYHLSKQQAGNLIMCVSIGAILATPIIGLISDKIAVAKKTLIMIGVSCTITTLIPLIILVDSMSLTFLTGLMFLFGIFVYSNMLQWPYLKELVGISIYGTASGLMNFFAFLGGALFQQVMGIIISQAPVINDYIAASGFRFAFLFCFVYLTIALVIFKMKAA